MELMLKNGGIGVSIGTSGNEGRGLQKVIIPSPLKSFNQNTLFLSEFITSSKIIDNS